MSRDIQYIQLVGRGTRPPKPPAQFQDVIDALVGRTLQIQLAPEPLVLDVAVEPVIHAEEPDL